MSDFLTRTREHAFAEADVLVWNQQGLQQHQLWISTSWLAGRLQTNVGTQEIGGHPSELPTVLLRMVNAAPGLALEDREPRAVGIRCKDLWSPTNELRTKALSSIADCFSHETAFSKAINEEQFTATQVEMRVEAAPMATLSFLCSSAGAVEVIGESDDAVLLIPKTATEVWYRLVDLMRSS